MTVRAVVVGSGSAGRRHVAALRRLDPTAEIVVVRRAQSTQSTEPLERAGARTVHSVEAAIGDGVDVGIVASPSTRHRADAVALLQTAAAVLVEKPLAATVDDGAHIRSAASVAGRPVLVGYHLRWSETVLRLADILTEALPGPPDAFAFSVGQHLSRWRPGSDPAAGVSARSELGGGVLLELSHELDAVRYLLGPVRCVLSADLRTDGAPTDGVVDTVADLRLEVFGAATGRVHLDMTSDPPHRLWWVRSGDTSVTADLLRGTIRVEEGGTCREVHQSGSDERDRAEDALIAHLLTLDEGAAPRCTVEDGIASLAVIAAARSAAEQSRPVDVGTLLAPRRAERIGPDDSGRVVPR